ncbi:unnamed protein product [Ranitomeya imitator]|uniref:tRNA pseudouridine synthase n=1 Tax=Ranitomeya imitator TaxID=111125 RepID=A0ABN9M8Y4_9NEOB|nr:unnamed protein product [Ranitomeya imitator]
MSDEPEVIRLQQRLQDLEREVQRLQGLLSQSSREAGLPPNHKDRDPPISLLTQGACSLAAGIPGLELPGLRQPGEHKEHSRGGDVQCPNQDAAGGEQAEQQLSPMRPYRPWRQCPGTGYLTRPPLGGCRRPEVRYTQMLNRVLPPDIRVLSWAAVPSSFSARFSCRSRTYRYLFPRAQLDVAMMDRAAQMLEGTHDFRNLCKMDVANGVLNFVRTVISARVEPVPEGLGEAGPFQLYHLKIKGLAFLYHQVRCIMGVLFLIGQGKEEPEVIRELLDVEKNPCKPQYK